MFWLYSSVWDRESHLVFSWQQDPEYVPSWVSESELLFSRSTTAAYFGCSSWIWTNVSCGHFPLERGAYWCYWRWRQAHCPCCYNRGFLTLTHTTDTSLKSSSLKAFLEIGQIPKVSNPTKIFFMINETGYAEAIKIVRSGIPLFQRICRHPVIVCSSVICLKVPMKFTPRVCRWCIHCGGKMSRNILLKLGKS